MADIGNRSCRRDVDLAAFRGRRSLVQAGDLLSSMYRWLREGQVGRKGMCFKDFEEPVRYLASQAGIVQKFFSVRTCSSPSTGLV